MTKRKEVDMTAAAVVIIAIYSVSLSGHWTKQSSVIS